MSAMMYMYKIESNDIFSYNYYTYKEPFTGSLNGMRYRVSRKEKSEEEVVFEVVTWPEPYAEAYTDDALKEYAEFPFTEEGKEDVVEHLNREYQLKYL